MASEFTITDPVLIKELKEKLFDPTVPDYVFWTAAEVCAALGCAPRTLRTWRAEAEFPPPVRYPGCKGWSLGAVRFWLEKRAEFGKKSAKRMQSTAVPMVVHSVGRI